MYFTGQIREIEKYRLSSVLCDTMVGAETMPRLALHRVDADERVPCDDLPDFDVTRFFPGNGNDDDESSESSSESSESK